jgi:hypothetical protein
MPTLFRSTVALAFTIATAATANAALPPLVISEFRLRGPGGANDEFIEIYNQLAIPYTVAAASGTGLGVAASDGVIRFSIPNGTVIPARGYYLGVNSGAYSLSAYANADATWTTDIPDNAGIAIFNNNLGGASFTLANRMDAVGSTSEANTLYKEGAGYAALTPSSNEYSQARRMAGTPGIPGLCLPIGGVAPVDSGNNSTDFYFVATNGGGQNLGAPGPQNAASPRFGINGSPAADKVRRVDPRVGYGAAPNLVRDPTSDPANNSSNGTIRFNRTYKNDTGASITQLRFRVIDLAKFVAYADLRPRGSSTSVVTLNGGGSVTVEGTTLEQPPTQANGGGLNSTFRVASITPVTPLANGASVNVSFLFGVQSVGPYQFALQIESGASADTGYIFGGYGDTEEAFFAECGPPGPPPLLISELRTEGPAGTLDELVEVYNNSDRDHVVYATDFTAGYSVVAEGITVGTIPNGTMIPARGHVLLTNSDYSLYGYSASDLALSGDMSLNTGVALFSSTLTLDFSTRLDAVGSALVSDPLYRNGTGLQTIAQVASDHSFVRKNTGVPGSGRMCIGPLSGAAPQNTGDNAADFLYVDVSANGEQLGAPGPQGLTSPRHWSVRPAPRLGRT